MNVSSLIRIRLDESSKRNVRKDKFHLALVIESGGIRASSVGGMTQVLSEISSVFDSVHGSSAGACAGAYFATEQTGYGKDIFLDHLPQKSIMSLKKVFEVPSIVDVDTIVDKILRTTAPLNSSLLFKSQPYLNIVVSNRATGKPETLRAFQKEEDIFNALRASLRIPGPLEKGIKINKEFYLDGGYTSSISIKSAIDSGATHLLVLCAKRPQDYSYFALLKSIPRIILLMIFHGPKFALGYIKGNIIAIQTVNNKNNSIELEKIIRTENAIKCGSITTDREVIQRSWAEGVGVARYFLDTLKP